VCPESHNQFGSRKRKGIGFSRRFQNFHQVQTSVCQNQLSSQPERFCRICRAALSVVRKSFLSRTLPIVSIVGSTPHYTPYSAQACHNPSRVSSKFVQQLRLPHSAFRFVARHWFPRTAVGTFLAIAVLILVMLYNPDSEVPLMPCKACGSDRETRFNGEMAIHAPALAGLDKPIVRVFLNLLPFLDCGVAKFVLPKPELCSGSPRLRME